MPNRDHKRKAAKKSNWKPGSPSTALIVKGGGARLTRLRIAERTGAFYDNNSYSSGFRCRRDSSTQ